MHHNASQRDAIITLPGALRCAIRQTDGNVTYSGVLVDAGSRDEPASLPGLAHFVEHTIFKGTSRRSGWHISNRMESVGGELNAYTFKEGTSIYTIAPAGYEDRSLELIADLVADASFPEAELEREREVVVEEINSYLDSPSESVYDQFEELIYAGSPLAHNILGSPESVRAISSADCRGFVERYYTPANMVVFVASPLPPEKIEKLLRRRFGRLERSGDAPKRETPPPTAPFDIVRDNNGHQAHTILGARVFARTDPRRFPLYLLSNYLAGPGMNSRLNLELREKRGLVYTVDSSLGLLSDAGAMAIYFGTDRSSVGRCLRVIRRELDALAQSPISPVKFEKIKKQYCGQLLVSTDNRESMAMSLGKNLMYFNRLTDIPSLTARMMEVTPEQVREVAELLAPDRCGRLTLM